MSDQNAPAGPAPTAPPGKYFRDAFEKSAPAGWTKAERDANFQIYMTGVTQVMLRLTESTKTATAKDMTPILAELVAINVEIAAETVDAKIVLAVTKLAGPTS